MSNLQSTASPAHKWLRTNIAAALGIPTFNRVVTGTNIPDDFIVVGAVGKLAQQWAAFGNERRDEDYVISCYVRVYQGGDVTGDELDTLFDDAWQYVNGVVALITQGLTVNGVAGDPSLGGAAFFAQMVAADEQKPEMLNSGGIEAVVVFDIACRGQVTK